ncbi:NAD(P)-dependent oxidoreductase [Priestia abyssalis]|uniref:NAD(P)-dependent oxidoreductase n=1 Tax=Priestia abyssalis TaxID=1221450 RepID=UPI00099577B7|nr:NAD(P)-dependent oxidoreductase [Priestia abyssalis]
MENTKNILFIGLGNMGLPMASQLLKAGYTVYGVDANPQAEERFASLGGETGIPLEFIMNKVDVIMTSLPTPQIIKSVYFGEEGIIHHAHPSQLFIDFSTVSPRLNEKIAEACRHKNAAYLGAPVSGGVIGAEEATLTIMAGGQKEAFERAVPLLEKMGSGLFHVGDNPSSGTIIKLLNNLMVGFYTQAVAESVSLAEKMGVDSETLFDILNVSYGQSRIYERNYKQFIAQNHYKPGFATNLLLKDLKLAKEMAVQCKGELPIGDKLIELYETAVDQGYGEDDMASVYLMLKNNVARKKENV